MKFKRKSFLPINLQFFGESEGDLLTFVNRNCRKIFRNKIKHSKQTTLNLDFFRWFIYILEVYINVNV